MTVTKSEEFPAGAMLEAYARSGAYTDCFLGAVDRPVSLSEYLDSFYSTWVFRVERWILGAFVGSPSSDDDVRELASGSASEFAAWRVEDRDLNQIVLAAGPTRSWLMVEVEDAAGSSQSVLYFGSAVVPRGSGRVGWYFRVFAGLHVMYSRVLLGAAIRRLREAG